MSEGIRQMRVTMVWYGNNSEQLIGMFCSSDS